MNRQLSSLIFAGILSVTALLSFLAFLVFDSGEANLVEMYFELLTGKRGTDLFLPQFTGQLRGIT